LSTQKPLSRATASGWVGSEPDVLMAFCSDTCMAQPSLFDTFSLHDFLKSHQVHRAWKDEAV